MLKLQVGRRLRLGSYAALLAALILYIVAYSTSQEQGVSAGWVSHVLFPIIFFTTMSTAAVSRLQLGVLVALFVVVLGFDIARANVGGRTLEALSYGLHLAFLLYVIRVILGHVFRVGEVSSDMILGAVCAYLTLALFFNEGYALVETLVPGSFEGLDDIRNDGGYFSLVTLASLGYGDVVPVKPLARSISALSAVVGQFYIAVIVARLVAARVMTLQRERETGAAE